LFLFFLLQVSPEVRIVGAKSFSTCVGEVTKKTNDIYNSKLDLGGSSSTPSQPLTRSTHLSLPSYARLSHSFAPKSQVVSTGGKVPLHGPRRLLNPGPLFRGDYETFKSKFYQVSKSEVENYKILCKLASSEFQRLVVSSFFLIFVCFGCLIFLLKNFVFQSWQSLCLVFAVPFGLLVNL